MKKYSNVLGLSLVIMVAMPVIGSTEDCPVITLHYNERVPYQVTRPDGKVEGLTANPAQKAFDQAGLKIEWAKTPTKRQLIVIEKNEGCDCGIGWFKNSEREKFAKYTDAIYRDNPQIAITNSDNPALKDGMTVDDILSNKDVKLGIKDGYSYGMFIDQKIAAHHPVTDSTLGENDQMLKKVQAKRNDYFFMSPEEADSLIASSEFKKEEFKIVTFSDMPQGEFRYIICSRKVDDAVIQKLNAQITQQNR